MKIGLDARFYGSAGGLGRYSQQLVNHLAQIDITNQYVIFLRHNNFDEPENLPPNFKKILTNARWYTLKEQILMPWKIWRAKVDLTHFFHWNMPLLYRGKFIVTIHDLILLKYPSQKATTLAPWFFALKYWAYKKVLRHAIFKSLKIIVPSEFVKKDILANFQVPAEKVVVIYEGAGLSSRGGDETMKPWNNVIPKPYLLYIGVAYPHKNLEGLIKAFKIFCDRYSKNYHLVLVGQKNYFYGKLLNNETMKQRDNIIFTGFIPDAQLPQIYENASLYVFPSFYEGFGLPALEAMNYGLPVIAASNSCLPEILGKAALFFDPHNLQEIADKMWQVLSDNNLREKMKQAGFKRVKKYSWKRMAEKTLQIYQDVV